jgi:hypothetical protein
MSTNPFDRPVPTLAQQQQYMIDAVNESARLSADVIHRPNDPEAQTRQCLICLAQGPADLFEPMTGDGDYACKAQECCRIREAGERPGYHLSALLRSVSKEMGQLTTAELAALAIDLEDFPVHIHLSARCHSAPALEAERADRERRKRSRAAKAGAATRAARKSAGS